MVLLLDLFVVNLLEGKNKAVGGWWITLWRRKKVNRKYFFFRKLYI